ncbi:MAG TPA: CHAT domain-containing tetratricopeptide repeat protein [Bradyrhizobium sp.]
MRASFLSEAFLFRRASLRIVLIFTLALAALLLPMSNAFAQREIVEMNNEVIRLYQSGQKTEAIALAEKSVEKSKATLGADNKITATLTSQLGNFYREVGRFADAEKTLKTAVAILERNGAAANLELAGALNNLGGVYLNQEMYPETEALFRRSLAIAEKLPAGKMRDYQRGNSMNNLSVVYGNQANVMAENGQISEANAAYDRMIAVLNEVIPIWSKVFGPTNQAVANLVANRGEAYSRKQQYDRAEADLREALKVRQQALGPKHQAVATVQNNLANALVAEKKYPEAEQLLLAALATRTEVLGPNHPSTARNLDALSRLYAAGGNTAAAVDYSRKATGAVIAHAETETAQIRQQQGSGGLVEQRTSYFVLHVANLAAAKAANPAPEFDNEALVTAQWAAQSSTAAAVQQLGVRLASGGDAIAALVRDSQDTSALWRDRDRTLIAEMSKPTNQQNRGGIDALRKQIAQLEDRQKALQAKIEADFPDYAALSTPRPLNVDNVQKLLGPDEALAFFLAGDKESYVFALTHEAFDWRVIPFNRQQLGDKVAAFRRGLDVDALNKSISDGKPVLFNLETAYELYSQLLRPIEATIKDKKNLAVVPSGALTALPFHLLVTDKPPAPLNDGKNAGPYRDAAWLLRRHAVTVLPSVASLRALRSEKRADNGARPFVGFGDPVFQSTPAPNNSRRLAKTRGYAEYWTRSGIDRGMLASSLQRLPDTADEIRKIGERLGASANDIYLGAGASETSVKKAQLANYRVVYFATHGLVAGDVRGVGEPSLALSIPANPTEIDDGLLTSSEVAQLKLNADWVVLSACNTVAGDKPGAEALSGLARAFFYAGTRALLVSHWAVDTEAALRLTTSTFDIMGKDANIGRAEALRRAMLDYLNDKSNDDNANPAYWGPFAVVGEGAVK